MAMPIDFDAIARREFDEAFDWYAQRSTGAAMAFATEVETAIESIAADPDQFQRTYSGCQLYRLKRYPYCVVYIALGLPRESQRLRTQSAALAIGGSVLIERRSSHERSET